MSSIRILLADDHTLVREGLRKILETQRGWEVIGEASDGREAVRQALELKPDLVILDLAMPQLGGVDAIQQIVKRLPSARVLVLSMHAERQYAVRAVKAGASGYLTKDSASLQLVAAIRKVAGGGAYISADVAEELARSSMPHAEGLPHAALSDREYQVFQLLVAGKSVSEIGADLNLSVKTVSTHKAHVFEKMGLANQAELIHYAIRHRLADDSAASE